MSAGGKRALQIAQLHGNDVMITDILKAYQEHACPAGSLACTALVLGTNVKLSRKPLACTAAAFCGRSMHSARALGSSAS